MPYSGWDVPEHGEGATGFDPTGNSIDPSFYYALSPGGRFPGDTWSYLEGQGAVDPSSDRTGNRANPNYDLPAWLEHIPGSLGNIISRLVRGHEWNVRNNDDAAVNNPLRAGDVYQGWSGPAAPYGPAGGLLHGLLDQGSDHLGDFDYGQDMTNPQTGGSGGRHGGGHMPNFGPLNWQPYGGTQQQSQFVDWQPTAPFTQSVGATRFVPGGGVAPHSTTTPTTPTTPPFVTPYGGRQGGSGGGRHGGGNGVNTGNGNAGNTGSPSPAMVDVLRQIFGGNIPPSLAASMSSSSSSSSDPMSPRFRPGAAPSSFSGPGERGYDTNYLERGIPGWMRDPTTGILNTAGMPLPSTLPSRGQFATDDDYITALHDMGVDNESIIGAMNSWGTGGVVSGPGGYMFANDPYAQESALTQGHFGLFDNTPTSYGNLPGAGGGGAGHAGNDAATTLTSGASVFHPYF